MKNKAIGERSHPLMGGMILRIGANAGSVML